MSSLITVVGVRAQVYISGPWLFPYPEWLLGGAGCLVWVLGVHGWGSVSRMDRVLSLCFLVLDCADKTLSSFAFCGRGQD